MLTRRIRLFMFVLAAGWSTESVHAQLGVSLSISNTTIMRFEKVPARVSIKNNTGLPIPAGGANGYSLAFDIKDSEGQPVASIAGAPAPDTPALTPGADTVVDVDLSRQFRLAETARAVVVARVEYAGQAFVSAKSFLDVQQGLQISRIQIPNGGRTLTYALRRLARDRHEHLFLRVDDEAAGQTYGTTDLGPYLRQPEPSMMPDAAGHLHILHRSGPQQFTYHVARGDGAILRKELFNGDYKTVRMTSTPSGEIQVSGRASTEKDAPPILKQTPFAPEMHR